MSKILPYKTTRHLGQAEGWPAHESPLPKGATVHLDIREPQYVVIEEPAGLRAIDVDEVWLNQALLDGWFEPLPAQPLKPPGEPWHTTRLIDDTVIHDPLGSNRPPLPAGTCIFVDKRARQSGGKPSTNSVVITTADGAHTFGLPTKTFKQLVDRGLLIPGHKLAQPIPQPLPRAPGGTGSVQSSQVVIGQVTPQPGGGTPQDNRPLFRTLLKNTFPHADYDYVSTKDVGTGTAAISVGPFRITCSQGDRNNTPTRVALHWGSNAKIIDHHEEREPFTTEAELISWTKSALLELRAVIRFMETSIEHLHLSGPELLPAPPPPPKPDLLEAATRVIASLDRRPDLKAAVHYLLNNETPPPRGTVGPWKTSHDDNGLRRAQRLIVGIDPATGTDATGLVVCQVDEAPKPNGQQTIRIVWAAHLEGPGEKATVGEESHPSNLDLAFDNGRIRVDTLLTLHGWSLPDDSMWDPDAL